MMTFFIGTIKSFLVVRCNYLNPFWLLLEEGWVIMSLGPYNEWKYLFDGKKSLNFFKS